MKLTPEEVANLFDARTIVGEPASVSVSGAGGGQGLGGVSPDTVFYTPFGPTTMSALSEDNAKKMIGQIGGRRRSSRRYGLSSRRYRKTQKGGKRQPRLNVRISARIRLSRRSRQ